MGLSIIIKIIKQSFRDRRSLLLMTLFPIILIVILGSAFSKLFDGSSSINLDTKVLYNSSLSGEGVVGFAMFKEGMEDMGVKFTLEKDEEKAKDLVKKGEYSCFLNVGSDLVSIYKNDRFNDKANYIESAASVFVEKYNLYYEIASINPQALSELQTGNSDEASYVNKITVDKKNTPRAIDYYAVTMTSLILLYASMTGLYSILSEKKDKTLSRIFVSPVSKSSFFTWNLIGVFIVTLLQLAIVMFVNIVFLKVNFGDNIPLVILILMSEIIFAIGIGIAAAYFFKNENAASGTLNAIIPFMAFLGGSYFNLDGIGGIISIISNISPLKWINISIMDGIYNNDFSRAPIAIGINIVLAVILILFASAANRKGVA